MSLSGPRKGARSDSQALVLVLSEDGVVGLELVLLKEVLAVRSLDVEQGVAHADENRGRHYKRERKWGRKKRREEGQMKG